MSTGLPEQLHYLTAVIEKSQRPIAVDEVKARLDRVESIKPNVHPFKVRRGWVIALAAAVVVLIVIGGVGLLAGFGNESEPVSSVPETPTTVASTNTTLAVEPVLPSGDGPQLGFVPAESPSGGWLDDGVWFQGALYAISDGELFRSSDGFTWEQLPGPPDVASLHPSQGLETGGGLLVYAGVDEVDGSGCALPGDAIVVHTSIDGVDWKTSRIDLPIPDSSTPFGCYSVHVGSRDGLAVGPQGVMITALVQGEILPEFIFEAEFGLGLEPETLGMSIGDGFIKVTTDDGEVYEIDLEAAGYLDDIESWLELASDDPNVAELAFNGDWHTGKGYAWFSPDGQTWSQLDASGPLDGGEIAALVATSGGFLATSTSSGSPSPSGPAQTFLWETTDGTTWIQKSSLSDSHLSDSSGLGVWAGRLVGTTRDGVWTIEDTPQELIASDATSGLGVIQIGEFGLVGMHSEMDGGGTEVLFSADGTTWNRWTPPEFGPEFGTIYVVGIGDDFVVLRVITQTGVSHWVGRLP